MYIVICILSLYLVYILYMYSVLESIADKPRHGWMSERELFILPAPLHSAVLGRPKGPPPLCCAGKAQIAKRAFPLPLCGGLSSTPLWGLPSTPLWGPFIYSTALCALGKGSKSPATKTSAKGVGRVPSNFVRKKSIKIWPHDSFFKKIKRYFSSKLFGKFCLLRPPHRGGGKPLSDFFCVEFLNHSHCQWNPILFVTFLHCVLAIWASYVFFSTVH